MRSATSSLVFLVALGPQPFTFAAQSGKEQQAEQHRSGSEQAVQSGATIRQARGVDQTVTYQTLTRYGPWDDRNYGLTKADVDLLPPGDQYLPNVPAFFKVYLRKQQPALGDFYPRSAFQHFLIRHAGLMVNDRLYKEGLGLGYHGGPREERAADDEVILDLNAQGNEVFVAANPTNKLEVVAGSNRAGGQTMYFSSDGGVTWQFSQTNPSSCCDPTIAWSSDGSRVYQADLSSSIGVRWAVSTDKGQSWGPMQVLTASGSDKEFIHVDQSATSPHLDNLYITYHNSNVMQFARSTDMGGSFSTPLAFSSEPRGIGSDITTDLAGNIYYIYPALDGSGIRLLRSTDGGVTFGTGTQIAPLNGIFDFPIPAMETREAFIYVSADVDSSTGDVYVAWTDEANDSTGGGTGSAAANHAWIQVAKSSDAGASWTVLPHPHDATDSLAGTPIDRFHPWLSIEDGVVHIVYYDTRHSPDRSGVDLYYACSVDGGASWQTEERFTTETSDNLTDGQEWGDYNGLSVVLDNIVATWTDNRPGNDPTSSDDKVAMAGRMDVGSKEDGELLGYEYAAKFVCGIQKDPLNMTLARGFYATSINIHNPHQETARFPIKVALTFPPQGLVPGEIVPLGESVLRYDEAVSVDCDVIMDALRDAGLRPDYAKGFVVVQSPVSLDVTAVHTTATLDADGRPDNQSSIDVEQVKERQMATEPGKPADLVPVPSSGGDFCQIREGKLLVRVRNQGAGPAGASRTLVDFGAFGSSSQSTPALAPGNSTELLFNIPSGAFDPDAEFGISVDVDADVTESDEGNNTASGLCLG